VAPVLTLPTKGGHAVCSPSAGLELFGATSGTWRRSRAAESTNSKGVAGSRCGWSREHGTEPTRADPGGANASFPRGRSEIATPLLPRGALGPRGCGLRFTRGDTLWPLRGRRRPELNMNMAGPRWAAGCAEGA
jgi:hypothetical protein